jgi:2-polyprenyl-3-methyl-5-hydroxy-6-metoxy-1,4-benzoquinol methylase
MPQLNTWKDHYWYSVICARVRIEEIVKRAFGAYTVLDCGCNEGFLSKALMEAGFHVTSIDNDEAMIAKAKDMFGIEVIKADVNDLPYVDKSFDLVIGGEILEHLSNPGKGLAEMFRVSKERVIISAPIGEYWLGCEDHKWQIDATLIEHDHGATEELIKMILVVEFKKRLKEA